MNKFFLQKRQKSCADMILCTSRHQMCRFLFGGGARLLRHTFCCLDATEGTKIRPINFQVCFLKENKNQRWDFLPNFHFSNGRTFSYSEKNISDAIRCCVEICFPFSPASSISRRWHACTETSSLGRCARIIDRIKTDSFKLFICHYKNIARLQIKIYTEVCVSGFSLVLVSEL